MLDFGWLRGNAGSEVVTTICMCYQPRPSFNFTLVPWIQVIALDSTERSRRRREAEANQFMDGSNNTLNF